MLFIIHFITPYYLQYSLCYRTRRMPYFTPYRGFYIGQAFDTGNGARYRGDAHALSLILMTRTMPRLIDKKHERR